MDEIDDFITEIRSMSDEVVAMQVLSLRTTFVEAGLDPKTDTARRISQAYEAEARRRGLVMSQALQ